MPYIFEYFNVRGRAHDIRLMLEDNVIEYEDKIMQFGDWAKSKATKRFGQLPMLTDGDLVLGQSGAIARHIARKHDLYGSSVNEASRIDMVRDCMVDLREKLLKLIFTKIDYEQAKETFTKNLPDDLKKYEVLLSENTDNSGFFVGNKVSMADYAMFDVLVNYEAFVPKCLDSVPALKAFVEKMQARPNLAKYLQSERHKEIMITISDRLK